MATESQRSGAGLAIIAGALLTLAHFSGAARWQSLFRTLSRFIEITPPIQVAFFLIIAIASLGGIVVIAAGILIARGRKTLPRLLILLGVGFGTLGFLQFLTLQAISGEIPLVGESLIVTVGVVLALVARYQAKR